MATPLGFEPRITPPKWVVLLSRSSRVAILLLFFESSPLVQSTSGTFALSIVADVAKLADAPDLGFRNRRFQSVAFRFKKSPVLRGENAVFGLKADLYQELAETSSF